MARDALELLRIKVLIAPLIVPYLRRLRANGDTDPRATAKAGFDTNDALAKTRFLAEISSTLTGTDLTPSEWNACCDLAYLQM